MKLPRTRELLPWVEWRESAGSTNAELRGLLEREGFASPGAGPGASTGPGAGPGAFALPHGALLATADQTAGRGRAGRGWSAPAGTMLAISVLVRGFGGPGASAASAAPGAGSLSLGWLPLLAGSAVTATLQPLFGEGMRAGVDGAAPMRVGTKWPNDVHVRDEGDAEAGRPGLKLCGILCEAVPAGRPGEPPAVIVGMGVNVLIPEWELPTERATSLLAAGAEVPEIETLGDPGGEELADRIIAGIAGELLRLVELARSDPRAARARVLRHSLTLGAEVRVHLPGGEVVDGRAVALDDGGELIVDLPTGGRLTVSAADVEHLR